MLLGCVISTACLAKTNQAEEYRNTDLSMSTYKINDNYYASLTGSVDMDEHISIDATIDSTGYLELGAGYGDVFFQSIYAEAYASYGRTDTTDIYTVGVFAGQPLGESLMLFANMSYDWRRTQDNIVGVENWGLFDEEEWRNTVGFNYELHRWTSLSSTYNLDYLSQTPNAVDDNIATSWDVTLTANVPWFSPYVKYSKGNYRVAPNQERKSQDNIEIGLNFNF